MKKILLACILFQIYCALFGFDLSDEGYLMTFYQHFGDDPEGYRFGMQYSLTCYAGWLLHSLTPGILPMRLWGIVVVSVTALMVYALLRKRVDERCLMLGILIETIIMAGDPKPFGYNTLSALLAVGSVGLILDGLEKRRLLCLMAGGALAGWSFWFRLPNLALVSLLTLPLVWWIWEKRERVLRSICIDLGVVTLGYALGLGLGWMMLGWIGAQDAFLSIFRATADSAGEEGGTHPLPHMIARYAGNYALAAISYLGLIGAAWLATKIEAKTSVGYRAFNALLIALGVTFYVFITDRLSNNILFMLNGIALFGTVLLMWRRLVSPTVCVAALLLLLTLPLGSDGGFCTMWVSTWVALPMGIYGTMQLRWKSFLAGAMVVLALLMLAKIDLNCYYDPGMRTEKSMAIHSDLARGIHTTPERAERINPLLDVIDDYVRPGETLLAYDWSPMINYLTDTKPFCGNPWPTAEGYGLIATFDRADREGIQPPKVVVQHFYTHGEWSDLTDAILDPTAAGWRHRPRVTERFLRYLSDHDYRTVWTNGYFDIMQPTR